jgi:hypothetical protein
VAKEAFMNNRLARLALPAVLAAFSCMPASAQIRIGVDLGAIRIRVAPDAPPPPQREIRMERPSRNHIWIAGYWDRQDDRWAWAPGRWEQPGQRGSRWVKPRYQPESGAYRYEPGHWSHQRMEEGEDYSRWRNERGRGHGKHGDHDRDRGRDDRQRDH